MSVNTAHANNGVLIHAGEYILLFSDNVNMEFSGQDGALFKGTKHGRIYLTSHRMVFNNKNQVDPMQSFSFPFILLSDVTLEQPVFGANYIKGKIRSQPNGNFVGEVKFKLSFKAGGAIEFGTAMLRAARTAQRNFNCSDDPPPYTPSGAWHEAPPPAYQPPPGYYGWLPTNDAFTGVPSNSVFMSDNPPPYPGIGGPPQGPGTQANGFCPPPQNGGAPPSYPSLAFQPGYPGYAQTYGGAQPQQNYGWGQPAAAPGGGFGYPAASSVPQANGFPGSAPPYPPSGDHSNSASSSNSKEMEAAQSAYNNQPQNGYPPPPNSYPPPPNSYPPPPNSYSNPPGYQDAPPSYNSLPDRRNQ